MPSPARRLACRPALAAAGIPLLLLVAAVPASAGPPDGEPVRWRHGPLELDVYVSRTANLFHFVDQASEWDTFTHPQYRTAFGDLSERDRELLAEYAAVRKKHGWQGGMAPTFYSPLPVEDAAAEGVAKGHIPPEDARTVERVLRHFAERFDALYGTELLRLDEWVEFTESFNDLDDFAGRASRFCGGANVKVPVYPILSPSDHGGGGGLNGGRLTLEIPRKSNSYSTMYHEIFHGFLNEVSGKLDAVHSRVDGLNRMTLHEGLAYALSPGILDRTAASDPLSRRVTLDFAARATLQDDYVKFHRFGLALRPFFEEAWEDDEGSIDDVLAQVPTIWRVVESLSPRPLPSLFCSGPGYDKLGERWQFDFATNHGPDDYEMILARARPGDTYVFLFALEHHDRVVPEKYADLLPAPWAEVEASLERGEVFERVGEARGLRTLILAAPTVKRLERLIEETKLLGEPSP